MNDTAQAFSVFHAGPWSSLLGHLFPHPLLRKDVPGKVFLKEPLGLTGMEVSLGRMPAGTAVPFLHRHTKNEELYIFVHGKGEVRAGDEVIQVSEGSVVRFPAETPRSWRNTGTDPLDYIVIQARAGTMPTGTIEDGQPLPGKAWPS